MMSNPFDAPPPGRETEDDEHAEPSRRLHVVPDTDTDTNTETEAEAAAAALEAPAANPFLLPGLPDFAGQDIDPAELAAAAAASFEVEPSAEQLAPYAPEVDPDDFDDQFGDADVPDMWRASDTPAVSAEPSAEGFSGSWDGWLGAIPEDSKAPVGMPPDAAELAYRDTADPDDEWNVPDYDDPGYAPELVDRSGGSARRSVPVVRRGRRGGVMGAVAAVSAVAAVVTVVGVVIVVNLKASDNPHQAPPTPAAAPTAPGVVTTLAAATSGLAPSNGAHAIDGCTRTRTPSIVTGADPGDTSSGPDAVMAFEWGYYVKRSGAAARAVVAADAAVPDAAAIQSGIDQQPRGVRYCVYITQADTTATVWDVELHEQWPGEAAEKFPQRITTRTSDGRTLITGITAK